MQDYGAARRNRIRIVDARLGKLFDLGRGRFQLVFLRHVEACSASFAGVQAPLSSPVLIGGLPTRRHRL